MKRCLSLLLCLLFLCACGHTSQSQTLFAMDTVMQLTAYGRHAEEALAAGSAELRRLESLLSISAEAGDIYPLNETHAGTVGAETAALIQRALEIAEDTGGAFDPTICALMTLWGFSTGAYAVPEEDALAAALSGVGYEQVTLSPADEGEVFVTVPQGGLDLGGIAKGYAAAQTISVMEAAGLTAGVITLGGNVGVLGTKPDGSLWTVAIENPDKSGYLATMTLGQPGEAFFAVTSGGYERYFTQDGVSYHHILDPATGAPAATDLTSVTIVSKDGTLADGLSTALFVLGFDRAVEFWRAHPGAFSMVLVTEDGIFATEGLTLTSDSPVTTLEAAG